MIMVNGFLSLKSRSCHFFSIFSTWFVCRSYEHFIANWKSNRKKNDCLRLLTIVFVGVDAELLERLTEFKEWKPKHWIKKTFEFTKNRKLNSEQRSFGP